MHIHCIFCRSTYSPKALVTTFEPPGESIGTLYDNFEFAAARSPHVRHLTSLFCGFRRMQARAIIDKIDWMAKNTLSSVPYAKLAKVSSLFVSQRSCSVACSLLGPSSKTVVAVSC